MSAHTLSNEALARVTSRVSGTARIGVRTKRLAQRIAAGEIAIINHKDLDLPCAQALVTRHIAAVINAAESISGSFPNAGPNALLTAGIPLLDAVGEEIMTTLQDGDAIEIVGDRIIRGGEVVGRGDRMTCTLLEEKLACARGNLGNQLTQFVENTLSLVSQEQHLLYNPSSIPKLHTHFEGRHVLVVVRGHDADADLRTIRSYIRDRRPVLVAVDGGADLLLANGLTPDLIVGDMDSVSDEALRCGAELVVHAYSDARAPGLARLERMGLEAKLLPSLGTSEDVAFLMAYEQGADLIVAVGTHSTLLDFLEKSRRGMSSTFLVRLRVGDILVDAKGLSKLYPSPLHYGYLLALAALAFITMLILYNVPQVQAGIEWMLLRLRSHF